ncbi:MAG: histidinol-phosphatase HisJ [Bacillus sp. (in: firmicutes)]
MIADGHIHTPFCPHGTQDQLEQYVEWFIRRNVQEISFTEHAPLPSSFTDSTPTNDSGMLAEQLSGYLDTVEDIREQYASRIKINIGLEVDFIEGFEEETTEFLNMVGPRLDDSILSVHFLKHDGHHYCLDYSDDYFGSMTRIFGSVDRIYDSYYRTVERALISDLGSFKPRRLGHLTLIRKFRLKYPPSRSFQKEEMELLHLVKKNGFALDYNGAGTSKPLCQEPYPYDGLVKAAIGLGIPFVYGSDAHQVSDLGQGFSQLDLKALFIKPSAWQELDR